MKFWYIFLVLMVCVCIVHGQDGLSPTRNGFNNHTAEEIPTITSSPDTVEKLSVRIEETLKRLIKGAVRRVISTTLRTSNGPTLSPKCIKAFMKLIADLTKTKVWALKMLDASSKLPAGTLEGTFAEYGSFDECLDIMVPLRNGSEDFRGQYCAAEAGLQLPPLPKNYSFGSQPRAKPFDTISKQMMLTLNSFHYLHPRFGVCVPSSCSREDIRKLVRSVFNTSLVTVKVPKCYVKEEVKFQPIHIAVICVLAVLVVLALAGSILETLKPEPDNMDSGFRRFLSAFSMMSNSRRLMVTSKSNSELGALHGIRALSMAWIILGHTYIWIGYERTGRSSNIQTWFNAFEFEAVLNGWLSVEMFFFLGGLLACYATLQAMEKTKGKLNFPMFLFYRYIRLTPTVFMVMGLLFFLPLISSGPYWHEYVHPELEACRNYWWLNFFYISNWMTKTKICVHTTWYLAADFQMYIVTPLILLLLYRSTLLGMTTLILLSTGCNILVGVLTHIFELTPAILITTGKAQLIDDEVDLIHMRTYTHVGTYCVGMATGYILLKRKNNLRLNKWQNMLGWCASIFLSASSVYGIHRWNTGYFHGPFLTPFYAAMHRTAFTLGVAWVTIACVTGNAGPVNWILSWKVWVPFSKLTYAVYLMHALVIWTRYGNRRERFYLNHYNMIYEYTANVVFAVAASYPLHLLVEAPLNNLQHMIFSKSGSKKENKGTADSDRADVSSHRTLHRDLASSTAKLDFVETNLSTKYQNGLLNRGAIELTSVKTSHLGEC